MKIRITRVKVILIMLAISISLLLCGNNNESKNVEQKQYKLYSIKNEYENFTENKIVKNKIKIYNIPLSEELQKYTIKLCKERELDPKMIFAIMKLESNFNNNLVSKTNDYGFMQLHKTYIKWHRELTGLDNLDYSNPKHNILAGIEVYKFYFDYWKGKVSKENLHYYTLNSYNMGVNGYKRFIKRNGYLSRGYDRVVIKNYKNIKIKE